MSRNGDVSGFSKFNQLFHKNPCFKMRLIFQQTQIFSQSRWLDLETCGSTRVQMSSDWTSVVVVVVVEVEVEVVVVVVVVVEVEVEVGVVVVVVVVVVIVVVVVVVVVECRRFLINIIVELPGHWPVRFVLVFTAYF